MLLVAMKGVRYVLESCVANLLGRVVSECERFE